MSIKTVNRSDNKNKGMDMENTLTNTAIDSTIRFTQLVILAREMGCDRFHFPLVEETNATCDESSDIMLLRSLFKKCRYAPAYFGLDLIIMNYNFGRGDFRAFTFANI